MFGKKEIIELGDKVKDKVTQKVGVVKFDIISIHGCVQAGVQFLDEANVDLAKVFDRGQLEIVEKNFLKSDKPKDTHKIQLGDEVKDILTGFQGIASSRVVYLYRCDRIIVQAPLQKDGKYGEAYEIDAQGLQIVTSAKAKKELEEKRSEPQRAVGCANSRVSAARSF